MSISYLSYPFGDYNQQAIQAAKEAGFHMVVTTVQKKVKPGDNPHTLKRFYILRPDAIHTMAMDGDRIANQLG